MNLREEKILWKKGYEFIIGLDEAGRGPLAGPVVAGAVSIAKDSVKKILKEFSGIKDSKQLSAKKREAFHKLIIKNKAIKWGIGIVSERIIDRINIKNAAELAMEKAVRNLERKSRIKSGYLFIDGNRLKNAFLKSIKHKLVVKGDEKIFSCSLASVMAKVVRDDIMKQYHRKYPQYRFDKHKGYGTELHINLLKKFLPSAIHRKSFVPVKNLLKFKKY
ncbi:MAG: ribonuclease HII [Candidatus Parcubacteria bacterium]|nr:ribonuclease HII [Candidatus Parcubacteria bacterium]